MPDTEPPHRLAQPAAEAGRAVRADGVRARAAAGAVGPDAAGQRRRRQRRRQARHRRAAGARGGRGARGVDADRGHHRVRQQHRHAVVTDGQRRDRRELRHRPHPHQRRAGRGVDRQRREHREIARRLGAGPRARIEIQADHGIGRRGHQERGRGRAVDHRQLAARRGHHHQAARVVAGVVEDRVARGQRAHQRGLVVGQRRRQRDRVARRQPPGQHLARRRALRLVPARDDLGLHAEQVAQREVPRVDALVSGAARPEHQAHHGHRPRGSLPHGPTISLAAARVQSCRAPPAGVTAAARGPSRCRSPSRSAP